MAFMILLMVKDRGFEVCALSKGCWCNDRRTHTRCIARQQIPRTSICFLQIHRSQNSCACALRASIIYNAPVAVAQARRGRGVNGRGGGPSGRGVDSVYKC